MNFVKVTKSKQRNRNKYNTNNKVNEVYEINEDNVRQ